MLPKIDVPIFELTLPSSKKKVKYIPFTVKEEKILLIAQEGDTPEERLNAVRQILQNCLIDLGQDVMTLPSFDVIYAFIKIRSKSIGNILELAYKDNEDESIHRFLVNLDEIEVEFPEGHDNDIRLSENLGIKLDYPTIEDFENYRNSEDHISAAIELVSSCISMIYDQNKVYDPKKYSKEDLIAFIESIPSKDFEKLTNFFRTMPTIKHTMTYHNGLGSEKTIVLQSLDDFF